MRRRLAIYRSKWEHLSKRHEDIESRLAGVLDEYADSPGQDFPWSYAVIGTFGAGKTQLLCHICRLSLERGLAPLYFVAEDLFQEVVATADDRVWLPASLDDLILEKVRKARESLAAGDTEALRGVLRPRSENAEAMMADVLTRFKSSDIGSVRTVVLVDELEGQYGNLQERVQSKDRSPLREWLEGTEHLKFVALAPAGIYEMGGADQTRVERIVIPPADVSYVRDTYLPDSPGKANACWWLSRGKPRHLFKAYEKLRDIDVASLQADAIHLLVRDELDAIGQEPSRVPPAVLDAIKPTKYHAVLSLEPEEGETARRYVIDAANLDTGLFAERLVEAFRSLRKEDGVLIGGYFKMVVKALSNGSGTTYLAMDDLPELLALVLDLFLEYEHASPEIKDRLRELMVLYEGLNQPSVHVSLSRLWDHKETEWELPLSVGEIKGAFPFPIMNPMVRGHLPRDVERELEGQGLPIWKWHKDAVSVLFCASWRDFCGYSQTDEFLSLVLPNGHAVVCVVPSRDTEGERSKLHEWLERNQKLSVTAAPPLIGDFLLSAAGELAGNIPGELTNMLQAFASDKDDIVLSRKSTIYAEAIDELVRADMPMPSLFFRSAPPGADSTWGIDYIGNRALAVSGCALAFADMNQADKECLAQLRDLFKSGKEGKGVGYLHAFVVPGRAGHTSLVDDLMPRYVKRRGVRDAPVVGRLIEYLSNAQKQLSELARLISREQFSKLSTGEDEKRLLEAFWRATRGEFDEGELSPLVQQLQNEVIPGVEEANEVESRAMALVKVQGIGFGGLEDIVRPKDSYVKLLQCAQYAQQGRGAGSSLLRNLHELLLTQMLANTADKVRTMGGLLSTVRAALDELESARTDLKKNYWEYERAALFADVGENDIESFISTEAHVGGTPTLETLSHEIEDVTAGILKASATLGRIESHLASIEDTVASLKEAQ